jgi:D-cysteine desulfhydrase
VTHDAFESILPAVARQVPRVSLGQWPTPIEPLIVTGLEGLHFVKREDKSASAYGGNKVRCLEPVFGAAKADGIERVWATGAYGSNQAVAIATHAQVAGLTSGAVLFPQPATEAAQANLAALATTSCEVRLTRSILTFPMGLWRVARRCRGGRERIIVPGAATPLGALGHVGAALEVALDVDNAVLPPPTHVVLPVGSRCTSAGLLVGFAVAASLGLGFSGAPPWVHAVRISPWPVTARFRILGLAVRTAVMLRDLGGPDVVDAVRRRARLVTTGGLTGGGYGCPTPAGVAAKARFAQDGAPGLDTTYSAKAAAHLLSGVEAEGPVLFWSTKSSSSLAVPTEADIASLPCRGQRWLSRSPLLPP